MDSVAYLFAGAEAFDELQVWHFGQDYVGPLFVPRGAPQEVLDARLGREGVERVSPWRPSSLGVRQANVRKVVP